MISTELPRISSSRDNPNTTSPSPPTLATGAHSDAIWMIYIFLLFRTVKRAEARAPERGVHAASPCDAPCFTIHLEIHFGNWLRSFATFPSPCRANDTPAPGRRRTGAPSGCPSKSCNWIRRSASSFSSSSTSEDFRGRERGGGRGGNQV